MATRAKLKASPLKVNNLLKLWNDYNEKYFGGILHPVPIRITRARSYYGYFSVTESSGVGRLCISAKLHSSPELLHDTLLHEMVHQWLYESGSRAWDKHGDEFVRMAQKLGIEHEHID